MPIPSVFISPIDDYFPYKIQFRDLLWQVKRKLEYPEIKEIDNLLRSNGLIAGNTISGDPLLNDILDADFIYGGDGIYIPAGRYQDIVLAMDTLWLRNQEDFMFLKLKYDWIK